MANGLKEYTVWIDEKTHDAVFFQISIFGEDGAKSKYRIRHENAVFYVMSKGIIAPTVAQRMVRKFVAGAGVTRSFTDIYNKGF